MGGNTPIIFATPLHSTLECTHPELPVLPLPLPAVGEQVVLVGRHRRRVHVERGAVGPAAAGQTVTPGQTD